MTVVLFIGPSSARKASWLDLRRIWDAMRLGSYGKLGIVDG